MTERETTIDAAVDALFARAAAAPPASASDGSDERAAAIVQRALAAPPRSAAEASVDALLDPLLAAPTLAAEPGEPSNVAGDLSRAESVPTSGAADRSGRPMSDETPKPPSSRRPSLREMAESVKNRPSQPPGSMPPGSLPPGSVRPSPTSLKDTLVALEGKTPAPAEVAPLSRPMTPAPSAHRLGSSPGAPSSQPPMSSPGPLSGSLPGSQAGIPASGPISGVPVSQPAPSSSHLVGVTPAGPGSSPNSAPSTKPSAGVRKQGSSLGVGVGIGALGLAAAAAFALWTKTRAPEMPTAPTVAAVETSAPVADAPTKDKSPGEAEAKAAGPEQGVIDINQLDDAAATTTSAPLVGGPLPGGPLPVAAKPDEKPVPTGPGEELGDAIRDRAGGGTQAPEDAEPAAGEPSRKNVPDVPPTGAVTSAINAVKGGAKSCVAGADEPSSATITFSSSGAVQGVSVGGWAQGKSAAACIKAALQSARVPPFAKPTYATSVTIRP